jgi:hypothetical protein
MDFVKQMLMVKSPGFHGRKRMSQVGKLLAFAGLQASLSLVELLYAGRINRSPFSEEPRGFRIEVWVGRCAKSLDL